jgi:hypothetical protein
MLKQRSKTRKQNSNNVKAKIQDKEVKLRTMSRSKSRIWKHTWGSNLHSPTCPCGLHMDCLDSVRTSHRLEPVCASPCGVRWYACSWVMLQIKYKNKARLGKPFLLQSREKVREGVVTNDNWIWSKCDEMRQCATKMRKMRQEMKSDKVGRSRMKSERSNMGRTKSKDEIWGWVALLWCFLCTWDFID